MACWKVWARRFAMLLQCSLHVAVTRQSDYQGAHLTRMSAMSVPGTERTRHQYYAVASALLASQISARD